MIFVIRVESGGLIHKRAVYTSTQLISPHNLQKHPVLLARKRFHNIHSHTQGGDCSECVNECAFAVASASAAVLQDLFACSYHLSVAKAAAAFVDFALFVSLTTTSQRARGPNSGAKSAFWRIRGRARARRNAVAVQQANNLVKFSPFRAEIFAVLLCAVTASAAESHQVVNHSEFTYSQRGHTIFLHPTVGEKSTKAHIMNSWRRCIC